MDLLDAAEALIETRASRGGKYTLVRTDALDELDVECRRIRAGHELLADREGGPGLNLLPAMLDAFDAELIETADVAEYLDWRNERAS